MVIRQRPRRRLLTEHAWTWLTALGGLLVSAAIVFPRGSSDPAKRFGRMAPWRRKVAVDEIGS